MFTACNKKGAVKFAVKPPAGAKQVAVAGGFNGWKPVQMFKQMDGSFAATVPLATGAHEYKFVVDGQWVTDPDNALVAPNAYGTANSVARVK